MSIAIKATAEGVKQGVNEAIAELKRLDAEKKKIQEDLKIKVQDQELARLRSDLKELNGEKRALKIY